MQNLGQTMFFCSNSDCGVIAGIQRRPLLPVHWAMVDLCVLLINQQYNCFKDNKTFKDNKDNKYVYFAIK